MSDEAKKPGETGEWQMPEPVFRSSEGHTPRAMVDDDFPTDPGFDDEAPTETADKPETEIQSQGVRPSSKTKVRHQKKKKRGCLKSFALTVVVLVLSVLLIVFSVIYYFFYSGSRGPF